MSASEKKVLFVHGTKCFVLCLLPNYASSNLISQGIAPAHATKHKIAENETKSIPTGIDTITE